MQKSVCLHIGNRLKCEAQCPQLKVHDKPMMNVQSTKYLGDVITEDAGVCKTVKDRRAKGWGRVSQILGMVDTFTTGIYRTMIGLKLREVRLINSMLFNMEAWSAISDKELIRLEQVDHAFLRSLMGAQAKVQIEFLFLEFGILKIRHLLIIRRLMYHYSILKRDQNETIFTIYKKQKESHIKNDWFAMLLKDFEFIGEELEDTIISQYSKNQYKNIIKSKVRKAAFELYNNSKKVKFVKLNTQHWKHKVI